MFEPAPVVIRSFHLTALHNAYGLMAAAAETGKPYACWAHHMSVGGARTADQLVAIGYFARRLDAKPGEVDTYRYRITAAGCEYISKPCLLEESQMSETLDPDVEETSPTEPQPVDLSYPSKDAQLPALQIVDREDPERTRIQAADALYDMTPEECALLARIHKAGGRMQAAYSLDRVSLTKKGLIVLLHRAGLSDVPFVELTSRGRAAAALQAEMRIPSDDESDAADVYVRRHDEAEAEELQRAPLDEDNKPEADDGYDASFDEIVGYDESDPEYRAAPDKANDTQELPVVQQPDEVAELRADRADLIEQAIDLEAQIKALRDKLAAVNNALADEDGVIPDDPALAIAGLKLRIDDQQRTVEGLNKAFDTLQKKFAVVEQERDILKKDVTGLKLQIADLANSGEMGVQHDWTHKTTPADITSRTLAGWTPWHKEMTADGLFVVWERKPNQKPARRSRERAQVSGPASLPYIPPAPRPTSPGVLQPDSIVIPADMPADPAYRQSAPRAIVIDDSPEPLNPMSAVMASFTQNLRAQFDANPVPQYSARPNA